MVLSKWQVTAEEWHLKPFPSSLWKYELVLSRILKKKIIFSTAIITGSLQMVSVGCKSNSACLAAVTLGQILQWLRQSAQHGSLLLLPDPSLSRDVYDYHSYHVFYIFTSLQGSQSGLYLISRSMSLRDRWFPTWTDSRKWLYNVHFCVSHASILKKNLPSLNS